MGIAFRKAALPAVCTLVVACSTGSGGGGAPPADGSPGDAAPSGEGGPAEASIVEASAPIDATTDAFGGDGGADAGADGGGDAAGDAAGEGGTGGCALDGFDEPTELRCTGLYSDWPSRTISPGVTQYDPGLHLWSDGAVKTRWIYLPPGTQIDTSDMDEWTFPVGTKLWKQFVVGGALVETRMIHKTGVASWYLTTYRWSADASAATELTTGAVDANDAGYEIPSQSECGECHQGRRDDVLGFEAVSLSSPDAGGLPMSELEARGLLTDPPDAAITIPGTPAERAALGYLHANCGTACHNSGGGYAKSTGFFMRLDVGQLASVETTDTYTTGWNQMTQGFTLVPYRLAQCSVASSCVYYRMSHRDGTDDAGPGTQMPPIDTHAVDPTGMALVAAWIDEGCDAGPADAGAD